MKSVPLQGILKEPSIVFDAEHHVYTRRDNGEMYTGCTTISDAWDKSFFLGPWTAKMMAEELKSKIRDVGLMFQDNPNAQKDFEKIVDEAKGAAKRFSEKAKVDGTLAHDYIAKGIAAKIMTAYPNGDEKIPFPVMPDSVEAQNAINAFVSWVKTKNVQWLASEELVCSDEYRIGGTLDGIAVIDGITYLVDFKTSSQLSPSYLLQCAGYDIMLREMGFTVSGYLIVRIPKDGKPVETLTVTNRSDMDFFRKTFLMQRESHKFYVLMESRFKDERGKMKTDLKADTTSEADKPRGTPIAKVDKTNTSQENGSSKKGVRKSAGSRKDKKAVSSAG